MYSKVFFGIIFLILVQDFCVEASPNFRRSLLSPYKLNRHNDDFDAALKMLENDIKINKTAVPYRRHQTIISDLRACSYEFQQRYIVEVDNEAPEGESRTGYALKAAVDETFEEYIGRAQLQENNIIVTEILAQRAQVGMMAYVADLNKENDKLLTGYPLGKGSDIDRKDMRKYIIEFYKLLDGYCALADKQNELGLASKLKINQRAVIEMTVSNSSLFNDVMDAFIELAREKGRSTVQSSFQNYTKLENIEQEDFQIILIHNGDSQQLGHYICTHYVPARPPHSAKIYVYDSKNDYISQTATDILFKQTYPHLEEPRDNNIELINPSTRQKNDDSVSCGLFAMAYFTSLINKKDPKYINYEYGGKYRTFAMRMHLLEMLEKRQLTEFPVTTTTVPGLLSKAKNICLLQ